MFKVGPVKLNMGEACGVIVNQCYKRLSDYIFSIIQLIS